MKKTLLLIALGLTLVSCSSRRANNNVRETFPNGEISYVPGSTTDFIVREPDNSVWYVVDHGVNGPTNMDKTLIIPAPKK